MAAKKIKPPKGTRDLYPEDLLRQRYITNAWRDASIRCGFEEIAGPTFETTELYSVKSGEGILSELFQAFSGKGGSEALKEIAAKGKAKYALRPEFTPTLARMYAAHAKQLPKPCKWFTAGPYFRAERPQRGRLREFLQWNVDVIGDDGSEFGLINADMECIACSAALVESLGFESSDFSIKIGDRQILKALASKVGVHPDQLADFYAWMDGLDKRSTDSNLDILKSHGLPLDLEESLEKLTALGKAALNSNEDLASALGIDQALIDTQIRLYESAKWLGIDQWCRPLSIEIVRGLAYYTGTVFEILADGERAVAGGGRYDNLIELFGGPPTPACGFGMGDVVLGNLLDDKGLMPTGVELMEAVAKPQASIRPVAFVVPNGDADNDPLVHTLTANLRRGIESESWLSREGRKPWNNDRYAIEPVHTRISYKSTRNLGKLRADAEKQHARFFVEIHADNKVELTNMDTREPITSKSHGSFSVDPAVENYVGRAIAQQMQ
tara:strand:+ start:61327 stop:62820 length:1494 start_codon:yes stop_codon:yes gene_type:complete